MFGELVDRHLDDPSIDRPTHGNILRPGHLVEHGEDRLARSQRSLALYAYRCSIHGRAAALATALAVVTLEVLAAGVSFHGEVGVNQWPWRAPRAPQDRESIAVR